MITPISSIRIFLTVRENIWNNPPASEVSDTLQQMRDDGRLIVPQYKNIIPTIIETNIKSWLKEKTKNNF